MEQQLPRTRPTGGTGGEPGGSGPDLEQVRAGLDALLAETDRILDTLRPVNAEDYLQQNRQRGGE